MKITKKLYSYESAKGEVKTAYNFMLVLDNGMSVAIKPSFKEGYAILKVVAEKVE